MKLKKLITLALALIMLVSILALPALAAVQPVFPLFTARAAALPHSVVTMHKAVICSIAVTAATPFTPDPPLISVICKPINICGKQEHFMLLLPSIKQV